MNYQAIKAMIWRSLLKRRGRAEMFLVAHDRAKACSDCYRTQIGISPKSARRDAHRLREFGAGNPTFDPRPMPHFVPLRDDQE